MRFSDHVPGVAPPPSWTLVGTSIRSGHLFMEFDLGVLHVDLTNSSLTYPAHYLKSYQSAIPCDTATPGSCLGGGEVREGASCFGKDQHCHQVAYTWNTVCFAPDSSLPFSSNCITFFLFCFASCRFPMPVQRNFSAQLQSKVMEFTILLNNLKCECLIV